MSYEVTVCPKCKRENASELKECVHCGRNLLDVAITRVDTKNGTKEIIKRRRSPRVCPKCDWSNPGSYEECGKCGHRFVRKPKPVEAPEVKEEEPVPVPEEVMAEIVDRYKKTERKKRKPGKLSKVVRVIAVLIVIRLFIGAGDFITLMSAPQEIQALADSAGLNNTGKLLLYGSDPLLLDKQSMLTRCGIDASGTDFLELGCYVPSKNQISLLSIDRTEIQGQASVTAAHEALHVAYAKLETEEKAEVDAMIARQMASIKDDELNARLKVYDELEPGERNNELHSILATEYMTLNTELEQYYMKFFTNRSSVVYVYQNVQAAFNNLAKKISDQESTIKRFKDAADSAYYYHVQAARNGSSYYANYNYDIYVKNFNKLKELVAAYELDVNNYNDLARSFRGQPRAAQYSAPTQQPGL